MPRNPDRTRQMLVSRRSWGLPRQRCLPARPVPASVGSGGPRAFRGLFWVPALSMDTVPPRKTRSNNYRSNTGLHHLPACLDTVRKYRRPVPMVACPVVFGGTAGSAGAAAASWRSRCSPISRLSFLRQEVLSSHRLERTALPNIRGPVTGEG